MESPRGFLTAVGKQDEGTPPSCGRLPLLWGFSSIFLPPDKLQGVDRRLVVAIGTAAPLFGKWSIVIMVAAFVPQNWAEYFISSTYVTKFSTISLYLTNVKSQSFAIASSVNYSEIRQNFSYNVSLFCIS